jgi:hypothetical protein
MRKSYLAIALCLLTLCAGNAHAQGNAMGVFTWNWSLPVSDTKTFTDNDSWLGASLAGRYFPRSDRFSIGADFGWNEFYNTTSEVIEFESGSLSGAVSGRQYRNLNIFPMLATGHFYFGNEGTARPYLGFGAGAYYIRELMDIGLYSIQTQNWHFGISPEFGVLIPTAAGYGKQAVVSLRYHYPLEAGDDYIGGSQSFAYWTLGVGISWEPE